MPVAGSGSRTCQGLAGTQTTPAQKQGYYLHKDLHMQCPSWPLCLRGICVGVSRGVA